jgi:hypothetical protein
VPDGSGFDLVENKQSVEDYFYETQVALEALALAAKNTAGVDMETGFDIAGAALGADLSGAKQIWTLCNSNETLTRAAVIAGACTLPTLTCGDSVTAQYLDPQEYSVHVQNNTWSIQYSNGHVLATEKVGVAATFITPVTQLCFSLGACPNMQTILLDEPILPTSDSNLIVGDSFVLDIDDSKDYLHSHYDALKTAASAMGSLPDAFGMLGLPQANVDSATAIYNACASESDIIQCEKNVVHAATCLGDTVDCSDGEKWFYNDGDMYSVDTTESAWTVRYGDKVLATAPIGQGATTITPITQVDPNNPVSVSLATPFEPLYLGAYDLGTTVTCSFGTPTATCTDDVLALSGCYATFREECDNTPLAGDYINKQCCQCNGVS